MYNFAIQINQAGSPGEKDYFPLTVKTNNIKNGHQPCFISEQIDTGINNPICYRNIGRCHNSSFTLFTKKIMLSGAAEGESDRSELIFNQGQQLARMAEEQSISLQNRGKAEIHSRPKTGRKVALMAGIALLSEGVSRNYLPEKSELPENALRDSLHQGIHNNSADNSITSGQQKTEPVDTVSPLLVTTVTAWHVTERIPRSKTVLTSLTAAFITLSVILAKKWKNIFFNKASNVNQSPDSAVALRYQQLKPEYTKISWRNKLIDYLIDLSPAFNRNISNQTLAKQIITLIKLDTEYEYYFSRALLYRSGCYGEKMGEYNDPSIINTLMADALSFLMFNQTLDNYILNMFSANRKITVKNFHKKLRSWVFDTNNELPLVQFFNERYLSPLMPTLYIDEKDYRYNNLLVGTSTWWVFYFGAQSEWRDLGNNNGPYADDLYQLGAEEMTKLTNEDLLSFNKHVLRLGIKIVGLYLDPERDKNNLTNLIDIWEDFFKQWTAQVQLRINLQSAYDQAVSNLSRTMNTPWYSRDVLTNKLIIELCNGGDAEFHMRARNNDIHLPYLRYKRPPLHGFYRNVTASWVKDAEDDIYCYYSQRYIKIPDTRVEFRNVISAFLNASIEYDRTQLIILFSSKDYELNNFSVENYSFISDAALLVIDPILRFKRGPASWWTNTPSQKWYPSSDYIFFNATYNREIRIYVIYRRINHYEIKKLDIKNLFKSIRYTFDEWPDGSDGQFSLSLSARLDTTLKKSKKEPLSFFISKLSQHKFAKYNDILYINGLDISAGEIVTEFMKEVLIPFYGCVKGIQQKDATATVTNCFLDIAFVLWPFMKQSGIINRNMFNKLHQSISKFVYATPLYSVDKTGVVKKRILNINGVILNVDNITPGFYKRMTTSTLRMLFDTIDPGLVVLYQFTIKSKKTFSASGRRVITRTLAKLANNSKYLTDFLLRLNKLADFSKSMIKVGRTTNRGFISGDHQDATNIVSPAVFMLNKDAYILASINNVTILVELTEDLNAYGQKTLTLLNPKNGMATLINFIITPDILSPCSLVTSFDTKEAVTNFRLFKNRDEYLVPIYSNSEFPRKFHKIIFYPEYQLGKSIGTENPALFNLLVLDDNFYIVDLDELLLRPVFSGDNFNIYKNKDSLKMSVSVNEFFLVSLKLIATKNMTDVLPDKLYIRDPVLCKKNDIDIYSLEHSQFTTRLWNRCYLLRTEHIKSRFSMIANQTYDAYVKLEWSSENNSFVPAEPDSGQHSLHAGLSLRDFIRNNMGNCDGIRIKKIPTLLSGGVTGFSGQVWIKINYIYYRLGISDYGWVLHCSHSDIKAAELNFNAFTETFEIVPFSETSETSDHARDLSSTDKFSMNYVNSFSGNNTIQKLISLFDYEKVSELQLRILNVALYDKFSVREKNNWLLLPAVHTLTWYLHKDVVNFREHYPLFAVWYTWYKRLLWLLQREVTVNLSENRTLYAEYPYLNSSQSGRLWLSHNEDCEAVWLEMSVEANPDDQLSSGVKLITAKNHFNGTDIIKINRFIEWFPRRLYLLSPPVTQFMFNLVQHSLVYYDTDSEDLYIKHPSLGILLLAPADKTKYVWFSPDNRWVATINTENRVSVFLADDTFYYDHNDFIDADSLDLKSEEGLLPYVSFILTTETDFTALSLCFISNHGHFFYPGRFTWHTVRKDFFLWAPPPKFSPTIISPDHTFLIFEENTKIILYDNFRKTYTYIQKPVLKSSIDKINIIACAFSVMNALVAFAFDNGEIFVYDLVYRVPFGSDLMFTPVAKYTFMNASDKPVPENIAQNTIIRFDDIFESLSVISYKNATGNNSASYYYTTVKLSDIKH